MIPTVLLVVATLVFGICQAQQLPTTCYQGNNEVFDDTSGSLCDGHACSVSWRAQVDWEANELLVFEVRIDDADQCVSNYGVLLDASVECTTVGYATADQSTLTVTLMVFYRGGSTAVATWEYRGAGLTCEGIKRTPEQFDALLMARTFQIVIGTPVMGSLTLLAASPLPLSAMKIECPLIKLSCQCTTGCAYTPEQWAQDFSTDETLWERSTLPDTVCGLKPVEWLARTKSTHAFPLQTANVLAVWVAMELSISNFHCTQPAVPGDAGINQALLDARDAVHTTLVETSSPSQDCASQREWAHETSIFAAFTSGLYANYSGPCSCADLECASRFDDQYDDTMDAPVIMTQQQQNQVDSESNHRPQDWDTITIIFFSVMLALGVCVILLMIGIAAICVLSPVVGPRGFRSLMGNEIDRAGQRLIDDPSGFNVVPVGK